MTQNGILPAGGSEGLHDYLESNRSVAAASALDLILRDIAGHVASLIAEPEGVFTRRPLVSVGCPWGRGRPCAKVIAEIFATDWGPLLRQPVRDLFGWDLLAIPGTRRTLTLHCQNARHGPKIADRDELRREYERARREGPAGRYFLQT